MKHSVLICPVCSSALELEGASYQCSKGHCFDISKKGSVNLLLKGGDHGDERSMLWARRDFLSAGYYSSLATTVRNIASEHGGIILDMGCGEGYYSEALVGIDGAKVYAFDISKYAAAMTAGRNKSITSFVASSFDIPVRTGSIDCAVSIFAPFDDAEVYRVLSPKGALVTAFPLPDHLLELKEAVYDSVMLNPDSVPEHNGFELASISYVRFNMHIDQNEHIKALFDMTPYAYNTPPMLIKRLDGINTLDCRGAVAVATYKKRP